MFLIPVLKNTHVPEFVDSDYRKAGENKCRVRKTKPEAERWPTTQKPLLCRLNFCCYQTKRTYRLFLPGRHLPDLGNNFSCDEDWRAQLPSIFICSPASNNGRFTANLLSSFHQKVAPAKRKTYSETYFGRTSDDNLW